MVSILDDPTLHDSSQVPMREVLSYLSSVAESKSMDAGVVDGCASCLTVMAKISGQ